VAQVVALVLGLATSLVAWWLVARYLTPRLAISEISRVADPKGEGGWRYHVKVVNRTRHPVAELSIDVVLVLPGLNREIPDVEFRYRIPIGAGSLYPVLDAKECVLVGLRVNDVEGPALEWLPSDVRNRLALRAVALEELLSLSPDASLRVAVRAAHHFSGYKRTYSLQYHGENIKDGVFQDRLAVEIVRPSGLASRPRDD
jgi:hypothetical protein